MDLADDTPLCFYSTKFEEGRQTSSYHQVSNEMLQVGSIGPVLEQVPYDSIRCSEFTLTICNITIVSMSLVENSASYIGGEPDIQGNGSSLLRLCGLGVNVKLCTRKSGPGILYACLE